MLCYVMSNYNIVWYVMLYYLDQGEATQDEVVGGEGPAAIFRHVAAHLLPTYHIT